MLKYYQKEVVKIVKAPVSAQALKRLPAYLQYTKSEMLNNVAYISATTIAKALGLNDVQVRKDLASVSDNGKPKVGYEIQTLIADLETALGWNNHDEAVLVGAGKLGQALLSYKGFKTYGLNIVAAFDTDPALADTELFGKPVFSLEKLENLCGRMGIRIGIITVPAESAQFICDRMVSGRIKAIWNFAPVHLAVPDGIWVQNENMASSLALLSNHLKRDIR